MWQSKRLSPLVRAKVIFVNDELGNQYSFPVNIGFTLKLLQLTFPGAQRVFYVDTILGIASDKTELQLRNGRFEEPEGGWFKNYRRYFVCKKPNIESNIIAVDMLRRYQALTRGVTLYFDDQDEKLTDSHEVIAAIDFGSSCSGYAYSFKMDPTTVYTNEWRGEGMSGFTEKTPTTVLLFPNQKFHSFGYDAEDEYALLVDGEVFCNWYYIKNFKMKLYSEKDLRRDSMLKDIEGKAVRALDIFSMAIRNMVKHLKEDLKKRNTNLTDKSIFWVLTVPAIWSDAAKQFMREAAINAGIESNFLKLVLEPEAASLYCRTRDLSDMQVISGTMNGNPLDVGKRYILLDLGGGTADMSAHEVLPDGFLKEIHRPTGDALGGMTVDVAFNKVMSELVGPDNMLTFFQDYRQDYRDFEAKKRLPTDLNSSIVFKLPRSLCDILRKFSDATMEEMVNKSQYAQHIKVNGDKMMFDGEVMQQLFKVTVDGIVKYIKAMKMNERLRDVNTIVLAGGFSKSVYVQKAITDNFPNDLIICPSDPGIAILKGAILLGFNSKLIVERVAKYTYGVNFARKPFCEDSGDPPQLKASRNGETYCDDVFEKLVEVGQTINCTDVFTVYRTSYLTRKYSKQRPLYTKLFASLEKNPQYCTEDCFCVKIGEIVREPPAEGWPDVVESKITITFGETELMMEIDETSTGMKYRARIDTL